MVKKYLSILMVLFAYSILLLHNCIPHDNHLAGEKHAVHTDKDHDHDTDDDDDDHDFLTHAFSHFQHDPGSDNISLVKENLGAQHQINIVKAFIPLINYFVLNLPVERKQVYLPPRHPFSIYSFLSFTTDPLRGPPSLMA